MKVLKTSLVIMAVVIAAASQYTQTVKAEDMAVVEKNVVETVKVKDTTYDGFTEKMNDLLETRKILTEQYKNETNYETKREIENALIDIDYSRDWYGICTDTRFYSEKTYKEKGLTNWEEGSYVYDSFTSSFIDDTMEVKRITKNLFN
jgi:signal transduction histidine kinase